jgi:uncharacterized membrane protein
MSDLIVVAFNTESGAQKLRKALVQMRKEELVELDDAAIVIRKPDGHAKVKQVDSLTGIGALGGAFWGLLIGLLFMMPWLGLAVGALAGAAGGHFTDIGVDDDFIKEVGNTIEPGHSAIFLLLRDTPPARLTAVLRESNGKILQTSLSKAEEAKLRATFGADEVEA